MIINEIRLLTVAEYQKYKPIIPYVAHDWWLKDSILDCSEAYVVTIDRDFSSISKEISLCVRPVLIVDGIIAFPEDKVEYFGYTWTVLDGDPANTIILCDSVITKHCYDKNRFLWQGSEIKKYLDNWLQEKITKSEIVVMYNNKAEFLLLQSLCEKYNLEPLLTFLFVGQGYLVYSPYCTWSLTVDIPSERPTLSFSEFCDYIANDLLIF